MIFAIVGEIRFFVWGGRGGSRSPQTQVPFSQAGMGRREQQLSICQKRRETWILKSARVRMAQGFIRLMQLKHYLRE